MDVKLEQSWNVAEEIWYKDVDRSTLCIRRLDWKAPLYNIYTNIKYLSTIWIKNILVNRIYVCDTWWENKRYQWASGEGI